ncbi:ABSCISIC ACID-INSENSITIVE 5-like protein [Actinidia chinensis var. chinensis]|uniref:ABSCISIC ACID-INSENSITIVE 5-like protein n=1 Tax=Actinidia chinensis var. chinensis TaxID=1590841 RepID=A0A2R6Q037_ACTCC|nr:ABSCISIC ACID-INSENSITIVE 5-like protein [Actinidia chinensis var. chinensis]
MGTNMYFKNYGSEPPAVNGGVRPPEDFPLTRQQSIYSLTFHEFQSTVGGIGKEFGSMNMDELLRNIWSAEETQTMGSTYCGQESGAPGGYLQRQGSLTLPRTLSQKTVDEVWRDIATGGGGGGDSNLPQRQQTLKEITLEEFLVRAGVVREDIQLPGKLSNSGGFGDLSRPRNDSALGFGFQQMGQRTGLSNSNQIQTPIQSANLPANVNGVRSTQQQMYIPQPQQQQQQQQHSILTKQSNLAYANPMPISNGTHLGSPGIRSGIVGNTDSSMNGNLVQGGGMGTIGLGAGGPVMPLDGRGKSNGDMSSVSPVPYAFNGGLRGRKNGNAVEKVVERRHRRMIKNRESAARSRARKQAYTTELEEEVAKLKEENQVLRKRQVEIVEMQKNQVLEMMNTQQGAQRRCLRRTQTSPW